MKSNEVKSLAELLLHLPDVKLSVSSDIALSAAKSVFKNGQGSLGSEYVVRAWDGHKDVGYLMMHADTQGDFHIGSYEATLPVGWGERFDLQVHKDYQNRGIEDALLSTGVAVAQLRSNGRLNVVSYNADPVDLYERSGFDVRKESCGVYSAKYTDRNHVPSFEIR